MGKDSDRISIVDQDAVVEGTLSFKGLLVVRGTVKGYLEAEEVIVAEQGAVFAEMRAKRLTLNGTFDGGLWVSGDLNILAGGKCFGKVTCKNLVVEAGGVLNADVTYGSKKGSGKVVDTEPRLLDRVVNMGSASLTQFREVIDVDGKNDGRGGIADDEEGEIMEVIRWPGEKGRREGDASD